MAETEKPAMSKYNKKTVRMKNEKSFQEILQKMENLKETEQGKLKGGITVIKGVATALDRNSGDCHNHGDCSGEENTGTCYNYPETMK
ncbi:hypothetical protein PG630_03750 [Riemerella anatipestifer]|nr:hypothetical protein [Riemerella anatipestifer]